MQATLKYWISKQSETVSRAGSNEVSGVGTEERLAPKTLHLSFGQQIQIRLAQAESKIYITDVPYKRGKEQSTANSTESCLAPKPLTN